MADSLTGAEAGLTLDDQTVLALQAIENAGGLADIQAIYSIVEQAMQGNSLSEQGKASLRRIVNTYAVKAGFIQAFDRSNPGWRITPEGREFLNFAQSAARTTQVIDVDSALVRDVPSNVVRGEMFEQHIAVLLKRMYPKYAWIHTGHYKRNERGLDFYGAGLSQDVSGRLSIGVQVKLHEPSNAPTEIEWLKFLSGCFARRVNSALFITQGL